MQLGPAASQTDRDKRFPFSPSGEGGAVLRLDTAGASRARDLGQETGLLLSSLSGPGLLPHPRPQFPNP